MSRWATLLHRIVSHPAAYDRIQRAAGVGIVHRHVAPWLRFTLGALVLDVGGRTGRLKTTAMPVRDGTVDAVTLALITHHLTDDQIEHVIDDAARVLGRDGVLLLYDAVWAPARRLSRIHGISL